MSVAVAMQKFVACDDDIPWRRFYNGPLSASDNEWVAYLRWSNQLQEEKNKMQRQFTIELRVDYEDSEKNAVMRQACQAAARHMFATANLIKDGQKPQVAIFSDDFYSGHEDITLLEDTIQNGIDSLGGVSADDTVSSELLAAVTEETSQ